MSSDPCCHAQAIHIVRGEPSDEELAALVAVLATLRTAAPLRPPGKMSMWRLSLLR